MHNKSRPALACVAALAAPQIALAQAAAAPEPAASASDRDGVQQVVVTASKRRERLQDAPVAATVLTGATIDKLGVESFGDYVSLVPNLAQAGGATPGLGTVVMRGMYTGSQQTTNTTAFYIGESPFSASGALSVGALVTPDPDLVDVDHVEVLKGPQGTLYGASSLGGLIRIIPQDPDLSGISGNARVGYSHVDGGRDGASVRASLNLPLGSRFGLRVGAFKRRDGGFVTNTETHDSGLGRVDAEGGSVTALAKLTSDWKVTLRMLSQDTDALGAAGQDVVQLTGTPVTGRYQFAAFTDDPSKIQYRLQELSTDLDTAAGTLTASVSHAQSRARIQSDYTSAYGVFVASLLPPGFAIEGDLDVDMKSKTSAEVRFATKRLGAFEGLAGLFWTDERNDYVTDLATLLANHAPAPAPFGNFLTSDTVSRYREEAVFLDGTYYLTDALDLGAGVRYAANQQHADIAHSGLLAASSANGDFDFRDHATTWQVTGRWRPSADFSTYLRAATGYRPGSPQTNPNPPAGAQSSIRPDTVTNLELGFKGSALDRHLSYDASVYHTDWKDVQLNGLYSGVLLLANAGRAKVDGVEAQVQYSATGGVSVGANAGFNDARLTRVDAGTAAVLGAAPGDRLPGSPRVTAAVFGDWRVAAPALPGGGSASVGATLRYQGDKESSYPASQLNPNYTMPAYTTLDLRGALEWDRYTLRLMVENVTNKLGLTSYTTPRVSPAQTTLPSSAAVIRPRTYSVSFGADF